MTTIEPYTLVDDGETVKIHFINPITAKSQDVFTILEIQPETKENLLETFRVVVQLLNDAINAGIEIGDALSMGIVLNPQCKHG